MQKSPAGIEIAKNNKHFLKRLNSAHIPQSFLNENIYDFLHAIVIRPEYERLNTNNNNQTTTKPDPTSPFEQQYFRVFYKLFYFY